MGEHEGAIGRRDGVRFLGAVGPHDTEGINTGDVAETEVEYAFVLGEVRGAGAHGGHAHRAIRCDIDTGTERVGVAAGLAQADPKPPVGGASPFSLSRASSAGWRPSFIARSSGARDRRWRVEHRVGYKHCLRAPASRPGGRFQCRGPPGSGGDPRLG